MMYGKQFYDDFWRYEDGLYHKGYRLAAHMVEGDLRETHEMTGCGKIMPASYWQHAEIPKYNDLVCPACYQIEIVLKLAE